MEEGAGSLEDYKEVMVLYREKIRKAKTQLELNLGTAIKTRKDVSINILSTKGGVKRISILYWM